MPVPITDPADPRVQDYVGLTDLALRTRSEPERGIYLAESEKVIRRALAAGHRPISYLMAPRWLSELSDLVASAESAGVPVYVGSPEVLEALTGFHLHRGALAAMHRPPLPSVVSVLAGARRVAVLEDIVDHTNVGADFDIGRQSSRVAIFEDIVDHTNLGAGIRSCAALGVDAFLVTPRCADPLYRRAIRVSMGTVFQVPWTRIDWPNGIEELHRYGYVVAGFTLAEDAITLDELAARRIPHLAMVFGTEGDGLSRQAHQAVDVRVRIPMAGGVDSLNVAAASAVAFYATRT